MLEVRDLVVHYGRALALDGVSVAVPAGQVAAIIGPNGAGKSTLLKAILGLVRPTQGSIRLGGEEVAGEPCHRIARRGMGASPEGRRPFPEMTVLENLLVGAHTCRDRAEIERRLAGVYALFPRLQERRRQFAGTLSGGEQQMLAIGRALMGGPRVLLLDEPSAGLAARAVGEVAASIRGLRELQITTLLVEQNVEMAMGLADDLYVLDRGRVVFGGPPAAIRQHPDLRAAYLGLA
jgi:branched-chain amino acid transport system ATP-binding protein